MEDQDRDHISSRSNFSGRSDQELDEMLDELRAGKIGINQPGQNSSEHDLEDTPEEIIEINTRYNMKLGNSII